MQYQDFASMLPSYFPWRGAIAGNAECKLWRPIHHSCKQLGALNVAAVVARGIDSILTKFGAHVSGRNELS